MPAAPAESVLLHILDDPPAAGETVDKIARHKIPNPRRLIPSDFAVNMRMLGDARDHLRQMLATLKRRKREQRVDKEATLARIKTVQKTILPIL